MVQPAERWYQGWVPADQCYAQVCAVLGQEGPTLHPWSRGRQALENVHMLSAFTGYPCVSAATSLRGSSN